MLEMNIVRAGLLKLSAIGSRMFRQNTGQAWVGEVVNRSADQITLRNYRPFHGGLCKGSSDTIGWTPVTVTAEMVGKRVAVFTAIEFKAAKGRISSEQHQFIDVVNLHGGIAGVARSEDEAAAIVQGKVW